MGAAYKIKGGGDANSWRQLMTAKGVGLATMPANFGVFWEDWEKGITITGAWNLTASGGASAVGSQTNRSCVHYDTGATIGNVVLHELKTNGAALGLSAATDKWYMAIRQAAQTATFNSTSLMGAGVANKANNLSIVAGVTGNLANFGVQYDGNFAPATRLDLGKVLDTAFHDYEIWSPGDGKLYARIDAGATVVSGALASPPLTLFPVTYCFNGSVGVSHQNDIDKILMLYQQA